MSHTIKVQVKFQDLDALRRAVEKNGGKWLGHGIHRLYQGAESGQGFSLPDWRFPIVLSDGTLRYDNYNGAWGAQSALDAVQAGYAVEVARGVASTQGWYSEATAEGGLVVFHPDGGTITVSPGGEVHAQGFGGSGCQSPTQLISDALGKPISSVNTGEFYEGRQEIQAKQG